MSKINFLKPDKSNLNTFLYLGSFLFFISVLDVLLNSFFSLNITGFLPGFLSFLLPLIYFSFKISFSKLFNLYLIFFLILRDLSGQFKQDLTTICQLF